DEPAQRQVVAADAGPGGVSARRRAGGVVLAQAHDDEPRHLARLLERAVLAQEHLHVVGVARPGFRHPGDAVVGAHLADQPGDAAFHPRVRLPVAAALAVLAVAAVTDAGAGAGVPEVARRGVGQVALLVVLDALAPRVGQVPVAGDVIGVVRHGAPGVPVAR